MNQYELVGHALFTSLDLENVQHGILVPLNLIKFPGDRMGCCTQALLWFAPSVLNHISPRCVFQIASNCSYFGPM